nr:hypothetical protein [Tanacetum cinerariifolium]
EEEILDFLRFLGHSHEIRYLTDVNVNKALALTVSDYLKHKCYRDFITESTLTLPILSGKILCIRDDVLFSTIKVVSRHQTTQQYSTILPIELTTDEIINSKAYKEYYACAIGEAAPKPKASARKKKGESASSTTPSTPIPTTTIESAPRLSVTAKGKQPARAITPTEPTDLEKVKVKVKKKKKQYKRKRKVLIRFPEHLKKVRRKAMMRR